MFGRGPMGGLGMPMQKAKDFKGTLRRLLGYLRPHRTALIVVIGAGVIGTLFSVRRPEDARPGDDEDLRGLPRARRAACRAPASTSATSARILLVADRSCTSSAPSFQYLQQYLMAGVAQKTVYALRREVEAKFERLPLKFFDSRTHGEILSRAVNDLDNISGTLQQNLTQLITLGR